MTRTRDSAFFASDVWMAAETMAFALREHGLDDEGITQLAEELEETAAKFFCEPRGSEEAA